MSCTSPSSSFTVSRLMSGYPGGPGLCSLNLQRTLKRGSMSLSPGLSLTNLLSLYAAALMRGISSGSSMRCRRVILLVPIPPDIRTLVPISSCWNEKVSFQVSRENILWTNYIGTNIVILSYQTKIRKKDNNEQHWYQLPCNEPTTVKDNPHCKFFPQVGTNNLKKGKP